MTAAKEDVVIGPDHPAWAAIDDDDWCGSTFSNYLNASAGLPVTLRPGPNHGPDLVRRIRECFERVSCAVSVRFPIRYVTGDATRPQGDGPKIIAHVCNNAGGWGAGFVLAVSRRWRDPERAYRDWASGSLQDVPFTLGSTQLVSVEPGTWVANMVAQLGYGRGSDRHRAPDDDSVPLRYEALRECLAEVSRAAVQRGASVHVPRIGCGLAGGRWELVEPIVRETVSEAGLSVTVYDLP